MQNIIFTGRFQPLHNGHMEMLRAIKKNHPNDLLIVCIIRNSIEDLSPEFNSEFSRYSIIKQRRCNNPLPNWERYMLVKLAIENDRMINKNTIIIFRDRSDIDWDLSIQDLPKNRLFIFPNVNREPFDKAKIKHYVDHGENIELIDVKMVNSATNIRNALKSGDKSLDFLPDVCREYFVENCMNYFI